jgi:putative peptide zinc metalloprotease protein
VGVVALTERSPFSPLWSRVAGMKPRLRPDAPVHRHVFRGQLWYVVHDPGGGRYHRFTPAAWTLVGLMDGTRTLGEIWESAGRSLGDELPPQDDVIQLLSQLHHTDLLLTDLPPDLLEMATRGRSLERRGRIAKIANPLAIRIPLVDPDRFLRATLPVIGPLYSVPGFILWLVVVAWGAVLAGMHWSELTGNFTDRVMSAGNLLVLVLVFPFVKAVHELSHGYATRRWGGEVHELGVMILVLMPIPYVDASAASAFRERHRRVIVGAAGIIAELFLAALAMVVWVEAEPGLVRTMAFNVMLIAGVSTLLFNGNPLLRYDGYYILADALEIPNLATRANRYIGYLIQRYLFGVKPLASPVTAAGEPGWFVFYGVASFFYRLFVWTIIVVLVASKLFFIGVLLAIWGALLMFGKPLAKILTHLVTSPVLAAQRGRAMVTSLAIVGGALGLVMLVPVPYSTVVEGAVWLPDRSMVHAGAGGFVARVEAKPSGEVHEGQVLIVLEDPILLARRRVLEAEVRQLELVYAAQRTQDVVRAELTRQRREVSEAGLARVTEEIERLTIRSPAAGRFILPRAADIEGRFVERGSVIGYVVEPQETRLRVVLLQDEIDPVRSDTRDITVRIAGRMGQIHAASGVREVPAAGYTLPTKALSTDGGGRVFLDPRDPSGMRTLQAVFQLELTMPGAEAADFLGRRAWVRFDHGAEPLPGRWYRAIRQVFLREFSI